MTRLLRFVLCLMLLCGGADAQIVGAFVQGGGAALPSYVSPLLFTTRTTTVGAGGTVFLVDGSNGAFEIAAIPMPIAGTFTSISGWSNGANGGTETLSVNGVDSSLTCTLTTSNCASTGSVLVNAGDRVACHGVNGGITGTIGCGLGFTASQEIIWFSSGTSSNVNAGATDSIGLIVSATEAQVSLPMPLAGTITEIDGHAGVTTAGTAATLTLQKNGSTTALACSLTTGRTCPSPVAGSVSVNAGDTISILVANTGSTSTTFTAAVAFKPATGTAAPFFGSVQTTGLTSNFFILNSTNASETLIGDSMPFSGTVKNLFINSSTAVTSGSSTEILRINAANGPSCTITSGTTCSDTTTSTSVTAGQLVSFHHTTSVTQGLNSHIVQYSGTIQ